MAWLRKAGQVLKYLPYVLALVKVSWTLYRAKIKQEGFRDALEEERNKRIDLERDVSVADRLNGTIAERRKRAVREAAERASRDN